MKQKPLHEIENEAAQSTIEDFYLIRPDLYKEELRAVIYHIAREGARKQTQLLTDNGYIVARTTGATPPSGVYSFEELVGAVNGASKKSKQIDTQFFDAALDILLAAIAGKGKSNNS